MNYWVLLFAIGMLVMVYYLHIKTKSIANILEIKKRKEVYGKLLKIMIVITVIMLILAGITYFLKIKLNINDFKDISLFSVLTFLASLGNISTVMSEIKDLNEKEEENINKNEDEKVKEEK